MDDLKRKSRDPELSSTGQGYNDSRGEIPDIKDTPAHNGQNLNNDPAHHRANEDQTQHVSDGSNTEPISEVTV